MRAVRHYADPGGLLSTNPSSGSRDSSQSAVVADAWEGFARPTWRIHADGVEVVELPATLTRASRITIDDGATFIGIVPLETTDLGRDAEIVIRKGGEPVVTQTGARMRESLLIESYYYRSDRPFDQAGADWDRAIERWRALASDDGAAFDRRLWFSDTYVRTPQGWKYVFGQASLRLPDSPAG